MWSILEKFSMRCKNLQDAPVGSGTRVLLRLDLNVPLKNGSVVDDFRIRRALPTLEFLKKAGARTVIVSHHDNGSLVPVAEYLKQFVPVEFVPRVIPEERDVPPAGSFIVCENLRSDAREETNDAGFAKSLAAHADIYVNEAFSVSHRVHASIVGVPKFLPSYAGLLFADEVQNLSRTFTPLRPFLFIIGGAKTETKLPLVKKFLNIADSVFVGGVLANDFFRAQGFEVGHSTVSGMASDLSALLSETKIITPKDVVAAGDTGSAAKKPSEVKPDEKIADAGPKALQELALRVRAAKLILWNGPIGEYENGFTQGTEDLARAISAADGESIVGGGDTLAAISTLNLLDRFSFVSTGGGAMLQFLADETLPGVQALQG